MKSTFQIVLVCIVFILAQTDLQAQYRTKRSDSELGVMVGGSFYIGDLNPFMPFKNTHLSGGLVYRYNVHSRLSLRANFLYGKLSGDDADAKESLTVDRNLNFTTTIFELAGGLEFNYFPFFYGKGKYKSTAYLLIEMGLFRMNPKTYTDDGTEVELQAIGTEGQGSSLNDKGTYGLTQFTIPMGVGAKFALGSKATLNFEIGLRKTFTDYIDDVGSDTYVDPVALAAENGPLAAELSNRSLSESRYGKRGNASTKDWYVFSGLMLTIRLGQEARCPPR